MNNSTPDDINRRLERIERSIQSLTEIENLSSTKKPDLEALLHPDDSIDLSALLKAAWDGKWVVIGVTFLFGLCSVFYSLKLPNIYRSEALLAPVKNGPDAGLGLGGEIGGLATLAGINLGSNSNSETKLAIEVLTSREFISNFIEDNNLLVLLMAAKSWDPSAQKLVIDDDIYDDTNKKWVRAATPPRKSKPSRQEAYKKFRTMLLVSQDKKTGFVTLSIDFLSPYLAKEWVDLLIKSINQEIKDRQVEEAKRSIKFLNQQLEKTVLADMRAIFYQIIEKQMKTIMFAEVRDEYVFKTVDSAIVPEQKDRPRRSMLVLSFTILGGLIGLVIVFLRAQFKE